MTNSTARLPIDYFPDPTKGRPVFNGSVYFGNPDTDPEILGNRKTVTLRQEDGTEVPVTGPGQPLVTGPGGVILYNGSPVQTLVDGNYSIKVLNSQGAQVYYVENVLEGVPLTADDVSDLGIYNQGGTGAVDTTIGAKLGESVSVADFMTAAQRTDVSTNALTLDVAAAITLAQTEVGAAGTIVFTPGSYKVDLDSGSLTITSAVEFMPGAIIYVYRTAGTNRLDIRGTVDHKCTQFVDVTNVYATKTLWDAAWDANGTNLPVTFGFGTTTYNQFNRVPVVLCPQNFGAVGVTGTDDSYAVQVTWDMHKHTVHMTDHDVTQVTHRGNELNVHYNNFKLLGVPGTTDYSSVLEIKCGFSKLFDVRVDAQKSQYYQTGVHWYTNDLDVYYPGQNTIRGLYLEQCYLGLCIGGLPGQSVFSAQSVVVTSPEATDAPLSESVVYDFQTINCLASLMGNQPNGKIKFIGGATSQPNTAGYSAPAAGRATLALADYAAIDVRYPGTEIVFSASNFNTQDASNTIAAISLMSGRLVFQGCDLEFGTQVQIKAYTGTYAANGSTNAGLTYYADSVLEITNPTNFGLNLGLDEPLMVIDDKANGSVVIHAAVPGYGVGQFGNRTAPFAMVTDTFTGLDAGATQAEIIAASTILINPYIGIRMSDSTFRDLNPRSISSAIAGVLKGLPNVDIRGAEFVGATSLDLTPPSDDPLIPSTITKYVQAKGSTSAFAGSGSPNGGGMNASISNGVTEMGWTIAISGTASVGDVVPTLGPIVVGDDITDLTPTRITHSIRLNAGSGAASITSRQFGVEPGRAYLLSYSVRTNTGSPGNNVHIGRIKSYDADGIFLSEDDPVSVFESNLSSEWQNVLVVCKVDANASKAALFFYVEGTASVDINMIDLF